MYQEDEGLSAQLHPNMFLPTCMLQWMRDSLPISTDIISALDVEQKGASESEVDLL
jgi:hypothetical protein